MFINILEYFEKTVFENPHRKAVIDGENSISFEELCKKSKVTANRLLATLDSISKPVAVYLPKSIDSVTANMGITYSGNIYMNLDIKTPIERLRNIVALTKPKILITSKSLVDKVNSFNFEGTDVLLMEDIDFSKRIDEEAISNQLDKIIDTDPYCIINTSGSTGTPKAVVLNHRSFIDFTEWANKTLKISDNEIIGSLSPLVFDIYSFEICMLMSKGSTIVILPEHLAAFPAKILSIMKDEKVSFIFWVPTIMVNIANMDLLNKIALTELKTVWFAGEVFPTKQFNYWRTSLSSTKFINLYGPIEITLDCTYYIVEREIKDEEPIPIGFPCRNTDILILNDKNERVEINEEGELCVRGSSLAMGYYNNPEKTSAAFVQNPLNTSYPEIIYRTGDIVFINELNEIVFKGRKDSLIKHMGYRIELSEIEHVIINTLKLVDNGCVVYNRAKKEISLIYESKIEVAIADLRKAIGEHLPKYMVPTTYIKMSELPRNTNGKIDRLLLNNQINSNE
jgi:amino acid adenylation domain-containing protein